MQFRQIITALVLLAAPATTGASEYPAPTGFVTDVAGLLPQDTKIALETKLTAYRNTTTIEVAVLIVPTLSGHEVAEYAQSVWHEWHVGTKGEDNGVLLVVVPPPEKKAWIATGYGTQGWLTDLDAKHIITDVMKPLNLQEKRVEAVVAGVDAIIGKLGNTPWAERAAAPRPIAHTGLSDDEKALIIFIAIILVLGALIIWLAVRRSSGRSSYYGSSSSSSGGFWSDWGGGSSSGGGGGFGGFGGGDSGGGGGGGDSG